MADTFRCAQTRCDEGDPLRWGMAALMSWDRPFFGLVFFAPLRPLWFASFRFHVVVSGELRSDQADVMGHVSVRSLRARCALVRPLRSDSCVRVGQRSVG